MIAVSVSTKYCHESVTCDIFTHRDPATHIYPHPAQKKKKKSLLHPHKLLMSWQDEAHWRGLADTLN